jgi:enterochelin esterase-like enzyme
MLARLFMRNSAMLASLLAAVITPAARAQWITPQVSAPRVQYRTFASPAAGTTVSFHIYTPPLYDLQPARRFPVLYWLHGSGSATAGIAPMTNWFAGAMAQGLMPPMIIVFPNGQPYGMYCDAADGSNPVETVIIDELIPHVDATFRTIPARAGRVLEGFSMGGYGTARFGTRYSHLFSAISILAAGPMQLDFPNAPIDAPIPPDRREMIFADVWNSDPALMVADNPSTLAALNAPALIGSPLLIRMNVGALDTTLAPNIDFHDRLTALNIEHTFIIQPGIGHAAIPLLSAIGVGNWRFYRDAIACTPSDIAGPSQSIGADGELTADDIIVFIGWFFASDARADVAGAGQAPGADGAFTADDIIVFINRFFAGC